MRWLAVLLFAACSPQQVLVVMNAQNNSGQSGVATLTSLGSTTQVDLRLAASEFGEAQPTHLHNGRCGEIGPKQDLSSRGRTIGLASVTTSADGGFGESSAEVDLTFAEITNGDWVINVHDAQDFSLYVSCGNIR